MESVTDKDDQVEQGNMLFSGESRKSEGFPGNASSMKEEGFIVTKEGHAIFSKEQSVVDAECIPDNAEQTVQEQENIPVLVESRESELFSGIVSSAKEEGFKVTEEENAVSNKEQSAVPKLNLCYDSPMDISDNDVNERSCSRAALGLSLELKNLKERCQKLSKERNSTQKKIFEMQSEFCSVEIERDLQKETTRYLEEQLSSLSSSLSLKENEILSLRKRYHLLNEGFLNSESLREGLENDIVRMTGIIRELEERLEISEEVLKDKADGEIKDRGLGVECGWAKEKAKLEADVVALNDVLEKERSAKGSLQEMFENIEKERNVLLKEVEDLRDEHRKQNHEVDVLRDLLHETKKEEQLHQHGEQQLQRQLEQKQRHQSKEITELQESKMHLSAKISLLEDENKKLEDELYQQLAVLEKLELESKSFAVARKEFQENSERLKIVGFSSVEQLVAEYSVSQESKNHLETKLNQLEDEILNFQCSKENKTSEKSHLASNLDASLSLGGNCSKLSCVPRSEFLKQKFQLKSLAEEVNALKQASRPKFVKEKFVKKECQSRKHESKIAKKWFKTIKDGMKIAMKEEDISTEKCGTTVLENKLHEANIRVDDLLHELEISKKENEVLVSTKREQINDLEVMKRCLDEREATNNALLEKMTTKLEEAEQKLKVEFQYGKEKGKNIVFLEEKNEEMCIELERLKQKLQSVQKENHKSRNELEKLKLDILKNFGSLDIHSVSMSLASEKEKSVKYENIIQQDKDNLVKLTQDLNSLQQVDTILRQELREARIQLEKKDEIISKKYLNESISEKIETDRLNAVMQLLESSKQNEEEVLAMYTKQKQEWAKLQEEMMNLNSELKEAKILLSKKEKECQITHRIMRELQATCEVYEKEFEKSKALPVNDDLRLDLNNLSSDESQKDDLSESGSDSTAENFREMQEVLQERMTMKVERLQNRLKEALATVSSCQELNAALQRRLHAAEEKILEEDKADSRTLDKRFLQELLNKLSEKEQQIQEMLSRNSSDLEDVDQEDSNETTINNIASTQKEMVKQLKIDNAKNEVRLFEANERIAKLEDELAICQSYRESHVIGAEMVENVVMSYDITNGNSDLLVKNDESQSYADHFETDHVNTTAISNQKAYRDSRIETNVNLKEELDCMTAKYANLKAAFEGCSRRLKTLETENNGDKVEATANESHLVTKKFETCTTVQEENVEHPYSKVKTSEFTTALQQVKNQKTQTSKGSLFSGISCSFLESDAESDDVGSDRMVIELTLTENDMDSLECLETNKEFVQERLDFKMELSQLRAKIIELEKLNSTITTENYHVKQCLFNERIDLENKMTALQDLNVMIKGKLKAVHVERDSLENFADEAAAKCLEVEHELERVQTFSVNEQQILENTIKELKDQKKAMRKRELELETERDKLRTIIEELQDCSKETLEQNHDIINEIEREREVSKKEKELKTLRISELKQQGRLLDDEMSNCKTSLQEHTLKYEHIIRKHKDVISDLEEQNRALRCEMSDTLEKYEELQYRTELTTKRFELNVATAQEEKKSFESKINELTATISTLEEALVLEKTKNEDFTRHKRTGDEESEFRHLSERKKCEDTIEQLQEKILTLGKEVKDLRFKNDRSVSVVKALEDKYELLNKEQQEMLDEKQTLKNANNECQVTIAELKEGFMVENLEKDNKILVLQEENAALLDERQKLTFNEEKCHDKVIMFEKRIEDLNLENSTMVSRIRELSNRISFLSDENAKEKAGWLDDKESLETTIQRLHCTITTMEEKFKQKLLEDIAMAEVHRENEKQAANERVQEAILKLEKVIETHHNQNEDEALKNNENANCSKIEDGSFLDNSINHLCKTILSFEKTIENEKLDYKSSLSKLSEENEHNIASSLNLRKQFEEQLQELQNDITEKETKIQEQKYAISNSASSINILESKLAAKKEENEYLRNNFSSEKQSLEDAIKRLQMSTNEMENEVKEKAVIAEETELKLQQTISSIEVVNQSLKVENGKLKSQVESCVDEMQRIKLSCCNERRKFEADVRIREESALAMEKIITVDKAKIQHLDSLRMEFETKYLDMRNELERVKKCSFQENQLLTDKVAQLTDSLSSMQTILDNVKIEKSHLVLKEKERAKTISSLEEELQRIKVSAFEERQTLVAKNQNENKFIEESKDLKDQIFARDTEICSLKLTVSELEDLNKSLVSDKQTQQKEIVTFEITVDNLQNERKSLEKSVFDKEQQILTLTKNLNEFYEAGRTLNTVTIQRDEELSTLEKMVDKLQNENKKLQDEIVERSRHVSLLQLNVSKLEEEKTVMEADMCQQSEAKNSVKVMFETLENQKKWLEEDNVNYTKEISLLKEKLSRLEEDRDNLANNIAVNDRKLADIEEEKSILGENYIKQITQVSLLEMKVAALEKENECLANDVVEENKKLFSCNSTLENLQKKNKELEVNIDGRDREISSLKEDVSLLIHEKEILRTDTIKLKENSKALEESLMKRDSELPLLEYKILYLEKEKERLVDDVAMKDKELSLIKQAVENLKNETKVCDENNLNKDNEISLLEADLAKLKKDKDSLTNDINQRDEELFNCRETIEKFDGQTKALEHEIVQRKNEILLLKKDVSELQGEKKAFEMDIVHKNEKLTAFDKTVENFKNERGAYEEDTNRLADEIQLRELRLAQLQSEKESIMNDLVKKDKELTVFEVTVEKLQQEKKALENDVVKQNIDISFQEGKLAKSEKERQILMDDIATRDEKICHMKECLEQLGAEKKTLEDNNSKSISEILFLKDEIAQHQQEKECFTDKLAKYNEEQSVLKITVDELQNEKTIFEHSLSKRETEISSLESKVFNFQADKEALTNEIVKKDQKLSDFVKNIEKLESSNEVLQLEMTKYCNEVLTLQNNMRQVLQEKTSLEIEIKNLEGELQSIKSNLQNFQEENQLLKNEKLELNEKLSRSNETINSYQEEINLLKTDLCKVKNDKENFQNVIREMHEKTKCDEADFDKLVAGYLQEIDSWKKSFGALEEETTVLKNQMQKLQSEKKDLEITLEGTSESKMTSEENLQENMKKYQQEIDSWRLRVQYLESDAEVLEKTVRELEIECERTRLALKQVNNEKENYDKQYQGLSANFQEMKENSEKQLLEKEEEIKNLKLDLGVKLQTSQVQLESKEEELHDRIVINEQLKVQVNQLNEVIAEREKEIFVLGSKSAEWGECKLKMNKKLHEIEKQYDEKECELKRSLVYVEELREENRKLSKLVSEKEESVFTLENKTKELTKNLEDSRLTFVQEKEETENKVNTLQNLLKVVESKESEANAKLNLMEDEINLLRNEISTKEQRNLEDRNSAKSVKSNIEKSREQLRILLADIDETSKIKLSLDEDLLALQSKLEQSSKEKAKLEMDVFSLKEITDELTKGKLTLLEEIARLSDQKKEGQELLNSEFSRLRKSNQELQNNTEIIQKENSELIVQISSLKVTLATVQSAYEQTQDEIENLKTKLEETIGRENQSNQERDQLNNESSKLRMKITYLEEKNRTISVDHRELTSSFNQTNKRLDSLDKELQTARSENSHLLERLKQKEMGSEGGLEGEKSSTHVSTLRKKVKEFRTKLGEEKKQRELHEFEIRNLREKVERFTTKEKEMELQLESNRKKLLEMTTERDGLLMDLDSVNKRKKKDMEGYTGKIESLEDELRLLKGRESKKVDGKQMKETVKVLSEEKNRLELKLTSNQERHLKEVTELKTTLDSLQTRYTTEIKQFEASESKNQNEILKLRKSLNSIEGKLEIQGRELEKLRANLMVANEEKEKMEAILSEKNLEVGKWKKEAMNDKAEIKFLRGSLNILEKEGFANKLSETHDSDNQ